jgi:hypothetical protein
MKLLMDFLTDLIFCALALWLFYQLSQMIEGVIK